MRREARRWFESSTARQLHHHVQLQYMRCAHNLRKSSSPDKDTTLPRSRRGFESRLPLHSIDCVARKPASHGLWDDNYIGAWKSLFGHACMITYIIVMKKWDSSLAGNATIC
jgi:hypothetical protein